MGNLANSTELSDWRMSPGDWRRFFRWIVKCVAIYGGVWCVLAGTAALLEHNPGIVGRSLAAMHPVHRVIVVWPQGWASGDYRDCAMLNIASEKWPHLHCALNTVEEANSARYLTQDVRFDGDGYGQNAMHWTCLNRDGELSCKN